MKYSFPNNKKDAKAPLEATNAIGSNGLVAGHAYALIEVARFHDKSSEEVHEVVQIRNPWGRTEWNGQWSDKDAIWETIRPDEKAKYHKNAADGAFWMSFTDVLTEFEKLNICYVPDETKNNYHRVIGDFADGENAPKSVNVINKYNLLNPEMTHQVDIIVKEKAQDVFIQLLLDCTGKPLYSSFPYIFPKKCSVRKPHIISMNLFSGLPEKDVEYTQSDLQTKGQWTAPVLPMQTQKTLTLYKHNG